VASLEVDVERTTVTIVGRKVPHLPCPDPNQVKLEGKQGDKEANEDYTEEESA
jgi:hypothetical protein